MRPQCNEVPASIRTIEANLKSEYDVKVSEYMATEARLEWERSREREVEFARLTDPSEQANYDIDLFLRRYFFDDNRTVDPSKTRRPIPLPGLHDRQEMYIAAERYGLHTVSAGEGTARVLVIGWNRSTVWDVANGISNAQHEKARLKQTAGWEEKMQRHQAFVRRVGKPDTGKGFSMQNARGSYVIECPEIRKNYLKDAGELALRITESNRDGWVGIFDFGILEGVMRLDVDREALFAGRNDSESKDDEEEDEDDEANEDDDEDEENEVLEPVLSTTNKRKASTQPKPPSPKKRAAPTQRRIHLLWRGRETGESEIQLDYDNSNIGHLDFTDATCTEFKAVMNADLLGRFGFRGYKVGGMGGPATRAWRDYSEGQYERDRVGRWG